MESITMTHHAAIRRQQRGIPEAALTCLMRFGKSMHDNRGGEILYFDKRAKKRCLTTLGKEAYRKLDGCFNVYAVRSLNGSLLTIGHRFKRLPRS
jgi:hypothetical protein